MYYRYWMHNDPDHHVPAHYGIRTDRVQADLLLRQASRNDGFVRAIDDAPEWEFYDLKKDKREMLNRYSDPAYQTIIAKLKAELNKLQQQAGDTPA